jgi:hypothetical protein
MVVSAPIPNTDALTDFAQRCGTGILLCGQLYSNGPSLCESLPEKGGQAQAEASSRAPFDGAEKETACKAQIEIRPVGHVNLP